MPLRLRKRARLSAAVLGDWHPWVIAITLGCVLSGAVGVVRGPDPRLAIDQYISGPYYRLYYGTLLAGGLVLLASSAFHQLRDRLMVEQMGLLIVSGALLIYQTAIFIRFGSPVGVAASISLMIAVGGLIRIARVFMELRQLDKESQ